MTDQAVKPTPIDHEKLYQAGQVELHMARDALQRAQSRAQALQAEVVTMTHLLAKAQAEAAQAAAAGQTPAAGTDKQATNATIEQLRLHLAERDKIIAGQTATIEAMKASVEREKQLDYQVKELQSLTQTLEVEVRDRTRQLDVLSETLGRFGPATGGAYARTAAFRPWLETFVRVLTSDDFDQLLDDAHLLPISQRLVRSGVIDPDWYLEKNEDVRQHGAHPVIHFLRYGLAEGRPPLPDEAFGQGAEAGKQDA